MANWSSNKRTDSASRVIMASPQTIYQAFLNSEALASWGSFWSWFQTSE
ncbi:hypothetical protein [Halobacillus ihumii]|nr:hypothetical protein [Halobacillus ihumii]